MAMRRLKRTGKVETFSVSVFSPDDLYMLMNNKPLRN
jgi:hypothetical protein